jgi:TPR repeat protein
MKFGAGAAGCSDRAELIKWWDALHCLGLLRGPDEVEEGLQMARDSRHPDAQWLASLFPAGVAVTRARMREVIADQGEDARALFVGWLLRTEHASIELLTRSAKLEYAPAEAELSLALLFAKTPGDEKFYLAQSAALKGDREGAYWLAMYYRLGWSCSVDMDKAVEWCRVAAELDHAVAQSRLGYWAFGTYDWERYYWWERAASRGVHVQELCNAILYLLPSFEKGENSRILHIVTPVVTNNLRECRWLNDPGLKLSEADASQLQRAVVLCDAMIGRARAAVACWSVVGLRCGVSKDIRVLISKVAWEEVWRWSEKVAVETVVSQSDTAQDWQEHGE